MSPDRFFRTGDVGHLDDDGFLYITGRSKDMIVTGGTNVYPAEIEAVLGEHPDVAESAVIGVPDPDLGERTHALVASREGSGLTEADVLEFLTGRLAAYKRPRSVQFIDALPRNAMGKVQKAELRRPYWQDAGRQI
jgi:acyl-CoA synthetase (AMP-forming)/AMP-acid ligase II